MCGWVSVGESAWMSRIERKIEREGEGGRGRGRGRGREGGRENLKGEAPCAKFACE